MLFAHFQDLLEFKDSCVYFGLRIVKNIMFVSWFTLKLEMYYIQKPEVSIVGKSFFTVYSAHCKIFRNSSKKKK